MTQILSSAGRKQGVGDRTLKRNAELYEKYKDAFDDRMRLGIFPPVRTCFRKACGKVYDADGMDHIYCTDACRVLADKEKSPYKYTEESQFDISSKGCAPLPPLAVLLEEGCITCANCHSKLPREHEDWWTLKEDDWYCIKCIGRLR